MYGKQANGRIDGAIYENRGEDACVLSAQTFASEAMNALERLDSHLSAIRSQLEETANRAFGQLAEVNEIGTGKDQRDGSFGLLLDRLDTLEYRALTLAAQAQRFAQIA